MKTSVLYEYNLYVRMCAGLHSRILLYFGGKICSTIKFKSTCSGIEKENKKRTLQQNKIIKNSMVGRGNANTNTMQKALYKKRKHPLRYVS